VHSSRRSYQELVDALPDVVFRLDRRRRVTFISSAIERFAGVSAPDVIGRPLEETALPPSFCRAIVASADEASRHGLGRAECSERGRHFRIRIVADASTVQHTTLGVIEDVTAVRWRGERRRHHDALLRAPSLARSEDEAIGAMVAAVRELGATTVAFLLRTPGQPGLFDVVHCSVDGEMVPDVLRLQATAPFLPLAGNPAELEPIWCGSPAEAARHAPSMRPLLEEFAHCAWAIVPVFDDDLIGAMQIGYDDERTFSEDERAFAIELARECGVALRRVRREQAERAAAAEATANSERLRREADVLERLVSIVGHDLRSPLNAIILTAQALSETTTSTKSLERIQRSASRMQRMIHDILDVARVRHAGELPVEPRRCDFAEVLADQIDEIRRTHPDREFIVEAIDDARGVWDPGRLAELLSNLLGNAVAHGGPGPIGILLAGDADWIELHVTNAGVIPTARLPTLFDPFSAGRLDRTSHHGLGLGLFISRAIVEAHGGTIAALSGEDSTDFVTRLPRQAPVIHQLGC
jgi:signal transduction histidine kinase